MLTLDEGKKMSDIISENEREEILNKFSDPILREEISKKLTPSL
jgi:hypothetical protein